MPFVRETAKKSHLSSFNASLGLLLILYTINGYSLTYTCVYTNVIRSSLTLNNCPPGQVMQIYAAGFGTTTSSPGSPILTCSSSLTSYSFAAGCSSNVAYDAIAYACMNKQSCSLSKSYSVFGNPCPTLSVNYVQISVVYTCGNGQPGLFDFFPTGRESHSVLRLGLFLSSLFCCM